MKIYTEQDVREVPESDPQLQQFRKIVAAGGVVLNGDGNVLLIFRRGRWDIPKGKLEDNEPLELCAQRETKEETGLTDIRPRRFLLTTYHTYADKKELVLKETHWYLYETDGVPVLTPQTDEDIFRAEWVNPADLGEYLSNTFRLVVDVLKEAGIEEQ